MVLFINPGLIDLRAIRTFGLNAKVNENPLGFFGTGSKYAIAVLLRTGHRVTLYRGLDYYSFTTSKIDSRGKGFDLVYMDGPDGRLELPFTLELGKTWEVWQAYRELASNALDEGGKTLSYPKVEYAPSPDQTAILVEGDEIESAHASRHTIFLCSTPILVTPDIEVHHGESKHAYYRGVRVYDLPRPSLFTYNLRKKVELTEDRTLKNSYELDSTVGGMLSDLGDEPLLARVLTAPDGTYEHSLSYMWGGMPCEAFLKVYDELRCGGRMMELTGFATNVYLKRRVHLPIPDSIVLNRVQQKQLDRAIAFCQGQGWPVDQHPIRTVAQQRNGLIAWAQEGNIVLTTAAFDKGTVEVAAALYEEHLHIQHGYKDHTRELQNHLFQTIMRMGQELVGEPL